VLPVVPAISIGAGVGMMDFYKQISNGLGLPINTQCDKTVSVEDIGAIGNRVDIVAQYGLYMLALASVANTCYTPSRTDLSRKLGLAAVGVGFAGIGYKLAKKNGLLPII